MKAFGTARLGSDMELRFMQDGTPVGTVSLAVRLGIKDKQSGEYKTQWIGASMFGKRAESLAPMLTKGSLHAFHLRDIHIEEYTTKEGVARTALKATIEDVELCGKRDEGGRGASDPAEHHTGARQVEHPGSAKANSGTGVDEFSDDIPFAPIGKPGAGVSWRSM